MRTVMKEVDILPRDLEESLAGRGGSHDYNEWVVRDFDVLGLFAIAPFEIMMMGAPIDFSKHPDPELRPIGIVDPGLLEGNASEMDILATFAGRPVWSFRSGEIVRLDQAGVAVKHDTIYSG